MTKNIEELKKLIESDPDFINAPRFSNSLTHLMKSGKKKLKSEDICNFLCIAEEELENKYDKALNKVRNLLKLEE